MKYLKVNKIVFIFLLSLAFPFFVFERVNAENGYEFWLRYSRIPNEQRLNEYKKLCKEIVTTNESDIIRAASSELYRGISKMLGKEPEISNKISSTGSIIIGSLSNSKVIQELNSIINPKLNTDDGFVISSIQIGDNKHTVILGKTDRAVLYGVFNFLKLLQTNRSIEQLNIIEEPSIGLRMVNHWDNPAGTIERGYAGKSIFQWDKLPELDSRYTDYARMLASIGINGAVLNNVNTVKHNLSGWKLLTAPYIKKLKSLSSVFSSYGVKIYISVNFFSPVVVGNLKTADPLDPEVQRWWNEKVKEIYSEIPDFGGFLIKADSEGEPGPMKYGRSHAEGANMLSKSLKPYGGLLIWRAFVYGHNETDRAMAAYDIFKPEEGSFDDNVIVQIKNGPIDFQVREPVSPLFGSMPTTNQILELQITQEYTGQSTHLCYLVPQWKEILDFDTYVNGQGSTIDKIIGGKLFNNKHSGITGIINIGADSNWTGHHLAQANTYGFGRLSWNPNDDEKSLTEDWIRMTFGNDDKVIGTILNILLDSWITYENYTSPLGIGLLSNRDDPKSHFYPAPHERTKIHHADKFGVGYDRTNKTGSGFVDQYTVPLANLYNDLNSCPDELLLFFHHVPYTHILKSGKTVIQHIYDSHFEGVERVGKMIEEWRSLESKIDDERFNAILLKLNEQLVEATIWRDSINNYFSNISGIPDEHGRLAMNN